MVRTTRTAVAIGIFICGRLAQPRSRISGAGANLPSLIGFDILEAIPDAAAELYVSRALSDPAPAFQRAGAYVPAIG